MAQSSVARNQPCLLDFCVQHLPLGEGICLTAQKALARVIKIKDSICIKLCARACVSVLVVVCVCVWLCGLLWVVCVCVWLYVPLCGCVWLCVSVCDVCGFVCVWLCGCVWMAPLAWNFGNRDATVVVVANVRFETSM